MRGARSLLQASAAAVVSLILAGAAAPKTYHVTMQVVGFDPPMLTIRPGDKVTFTNNDLFPHTATADDKSFDSKSVAPAATWTYVAAKPGTHTYICIFHPNMKGTITVQ